MRDNHFTLRLLSYLYLCFILFDGILRKWVLPFWSTPIMVVKQAIAILICIYGIQFYSKMTKWEKSFMLLGFAAFVTSMVFGHQNLLVAFYGCLPYWFGFPVCFILGKVLRYQDLIRIGYILVYASIINSLLLIVQFSSPVESFVNNQGGELDYELFGYSVQSLEGGFRPSGLFVYNSQNALFQMLALSYILFLLFLRTVVERRLLLIVALILNLLSIPFSVSRTNVFFQLGVLAFFFLFCLQRTQRTKLLGYMPLVALALLLSLSLPPVQSAMHTIATRFSNASEAQFQGRSTMAGTLLDLWNRNVVYNIKAIVNPRTLDGESVPFWGFGQGMSTQVGGRILGVTKNSGFALAEWDGLRIVCESGLLLGWAIILVRIGYAFRFLFRFTTLRRKSKMLSLALLVPFLISFYLLNNWGNQFQANISFLIGGLFLASAKYRLYDPSDKKAFPQSAPPRPHSHS